MSIDIEQVKELRDKTGISIMQCRKALEEVDGDMEKALVVLRKKSGDIAENKSGRKLGSGVVQSYIHNTGNVGAIIELSCETDFVSNNKEFQTLAYNIAMHVVATNPKYLKFEDIEENEKQKTKEVFQSEIKGKSQDLQDKIMEGKIKSYFSEQVLVEQKYIKDQNQTVGDLISQAIQKFGERIEIRRFMRFSTAE